jgi:DNA-binding transcriptional ArsR family regulator
MYEVIFGNKTAYNILLFLANYEEGYASKIAKTFEISLSMAQNQLDKFETAGVLVSIKKGKTRMYSFNPRYLFKNELVQLLNKMLDSLPKNQKDKYFMQRTRPRRKGKLL